MEKKLFEELEPVDEDFTEADDVGLSPEEAAFIRGYDEAG